MLMAHSFHLTDSFIYSFSWLKKYALKNDLKIMMNSICYFHLNSPNIEYIDERE